MTERKSIGQELAAQGLAPSSLRNPAVVSDLLNGGWTLAEIFGAQWDEVTGEWINSLRLDDDLVTAAREWLSDCQWSNMEPEDFATVPDDAILRAVEQHYDGGLVAFRESLNTEPCTCTYAAYVRHGGGTGFDIARYDSACPEHRTPARVADIGIEELELGVRAYNILKRMDVNTCEELSRVTVQDLNAWTAASGIAVGLPAARQIAEAQALIAAWTREGQ